MFIAVTQFLVFFPASYLHHRKWKRKAHPTLTSFPLVSIIVPCYNEEACIENCVDSLLLLDYPNYEIILVDDGSKDSTAALSWSLADRHPQVRAYSKANGGKWSALNYGVARAHGSVIVTMDADSLLLPDAITHCVATLQDHPECPAVAGNVKVINRKGWWGRSQSMEYTYGQMYLKRAFAQMGCLQVIPGALGVFRKQAILDVGGYSGDTMVEDMDLTIALARTGKKVIFNPYAVAYTEAPESFSQLYKQRFRWGLGGLQCMHKHRKAFGEWNRIGLVGLPIFAAGNAECFFVGWLMFLFWGLSGRSLMILVLLAAMGIYQMILHLYALHIDGEKLRQVWVVWVNMIYYSRLLSIVFVPIAWKLLRRSEVTWDQQRLGRNVMQQPASAPTPVQTGAAIDVLPRRGAA
jgi:poly-beta-1,6 N-acetyl-D-glucosamine synthase